MTLLRGKGMGLELVFAGRPLDDALDELESRLAERPGFYRGTSALVNFGATPPSSEQFVKLQSLLQEAGIELRAIAGSAELGETAAHHGVAFEEVASDRELDRRRALRPRGEIKLSDAARSLVADFAGARSDIAVRRKRGESSVPALALPAGTAQAPAPPPATLHVVESPPGTLYHCGTLRGGQALHHVGNIVVVGDVNPGAELVASGDIVVFGRLAGVAHAGAQGDEGARVYALRLDATQLRIATSIAADPAGSRTGAGPEVAAIVDGRIAIAPFDGLDRFQERGVSFS